MQENVEKDVKCMNFPEPVSLSSVVEARFITEVDTFLEELRSGGGKHGGLTITFGSGERHLCYVGPCPPGADKKLRRLIGDAYKVSIVRNPAQLKKYRTVTGDDVPRAPVTQPTASETAPLRNSEPAAKFWRNPAASQRSCAAKRDVRIFNYWWQALPAVPPTREAIDWWASDGRASRYERLNRPRKCLNDRTPTEVLTALSGVALRN